LGGKSPENTVSQEKRQAFLFLLQKKHINKTDKNGNCGEDVGKRNPHILPVGM
jgi:hypothetical protein